MQTTSAIWQRLVADKHSVLEYKFDIEGTEYTKAEEVSHSVQSSLFEEMGIGNASIAMLSLSLYAGLIPKGARIERYARLISSDGSATSEWLPAGVFFCKSRKSDDGLWTLEAYDSMRKADAVWAPDQALEFPMSMTAAVEEFCRIMGVELDPRTELNSYEIDYPANDYTIRNILQYIAAAHGGNWIITAENKLRLVPLIPMEGNHQVGLDLMGLSDNGLRNAVSRVTLMADSENSYTAGNDTGLELIADCPYASQEVCEAALASVAGYEYQAYTADAARLDPAAELGDIVIVGDMTSVIASMTHKGSKYPDIAAPGEEEDADEYPSAGPMTQQIERQLAESRSYINKTAEEINLKVEHTDGRVSEISQTVDGITLEVTSSSSTDGQTTAKIVLKIGPNEYSGYIKLDGNVDVSGQLSADALYAALGDIADLTVDRLSTSRRIVKYLAGDTTDDNYIRIADQTIELVTGSTDGTTIQAETPNGGPIYWEADITGAELGADGYPRINGERIFTTTEETPWPVMVYKYTEATKRSILFDESGDRVPLDTFGAGYGADDPDKGKGYIQKNTKTFDFWLLTSTGAKHGIFCGDDYVDIVGLRKTTKLDFSGWDYGYFYESVSGLESPIHYGVEFDSMSRPTKITDGDGHEIEIAW